MSDQEATHSDIPRQFYTEAKMVEGEVSIWAIPNTHRNEKGDIFRFILRTDSPWQDGAVKVHTDVIKMQMPPGINLYLKAIETLEDRKADAYTSYLETARRVDDKINELKMLAAPKPDPMDIVGEVVIEQQQETKDDDDGDEIPY